MSEKEGGNEEEKVILHHFCHNHPLTFDVVRLTFPGRCNACRYYIFTGEKAYTCPEKCSYIILHEECAEMPREITLSLHPEHTLVQEVARYIRECAVCECDIKYIGYFCSSSSDPCKFQIHVGCVRSTDIIHAAAGDRSCIKHPSHPRHEMSMLWRPGRSGCLRCDACGTLQRGNSYICITCQYCIHESCAALPPTLSYQHHAAHELSLVYQIPHEYMKFDFKCGVCFKNLLPRNWAYHCRICRFIVHIKCATQKSPPTTTITTDAKDVITFPIHNAAEELIESFVKKLGGMVNIPDEKEMVKGKYKFHNANHQLHLVSSSSLNDQEKEEDGMKNCRGADDDEAEEDDDLYHEKVSKMKLCVNTNGLIYGCTQCYFRVDIKCVSLPATIKHAAHPHHLLYLLSGDSTSVSNYGVCRCGACGSSILFEVGYRCDICGIVFHSRCCLLPPQISNRRYDKHPLRLTFDATVNHPGEFYCDVCEKQMNPNMWMYHCRECDVSVHPNCFPSMSNMYRNIKFGGRYAAAALHPHTLRFQPLTNSRKPRCDVCGMRLEYGKHGFQCCSDECDCDFFMCYRGHYEDVLEAADS